MLKTILALSALAMSSGALAQKAKDAPPPAPATEPDWSVVRQQANTALKRNLFDPESAQITWDGGWRWGHIKPFQFFSKRTWGWLGCASLNAKNRLGGYVGATKMYVLITPEGKVLSGGLMDVTSECDRPNPTPLQAAFIDTPAGRGSTVADELTKLAGLLEKGLITKEEFEAQKAKLLK